MTTQATLLEIATLAAGLVGRDLAPGNSTIKTIVKKVVKKTPKPKPATGPFAMFDAVTVDNIPATAIAVAGYVTGRYANVAALKARFAKAKLLTISPSASVDAICLDVETGDATIAQAVDWIKRQLARGEYRPMIYADRSNMPSIWAELNAAGIERDAIRLWVADWTGEPHVPVGYDACQWHGGPTVPYDQSLCNAGFLR